MVLLKVGELTTITYRNLRHTREFVLTKTKRDRPLASSCQNCLDNLSTGNHRELIKNQVWLNSIWKPF